MMSCREATQRLLAVTACLVMSSPVSEWSKKELQVFLDNSSIRDAEPFLSLSSF